MQGTQPDSLVDAFGVELIRLINKHSKENGSNTPDFILSQYLSGCLEVFDKTIKLREPIEMMSGKFIRSHEVIFDLIYLMEEAIKIVDTILKEDKPSFDLPATIADMRAIVLEARFFLGSKEKIKPS